MYAPVYKCIISNREEQSRQKIKSLKKEIETIKRKEEEEVHHRNEMIAHLKDQLQVIHLVR